MSFIPINNELLFTKNDPFDPRWGDKASVTDPVSDWILRGYPDEEGIELNGGRPGAAQGPDAIRKMFYKTTWLQSSSRLFDEGNLTLKSPLEVRHEEARKSLRDHLKSQRRVLSLGGGHDYGYCDGAAFLDVYQNSELKPVIINFDAHLDVRPINKGFSSGTPFYRLLNQYNDFHFFEVGIQPQCNSEAHIDWCQKKGGKVLTWPEVLRNSSVSFNEQVRAFVNENINTLRPPAYISLDIDCFENASAPGCSQSWPSGITPNQFFPVLEFLIQRFDIRVFGIYEVSPPLDIDSRTSKLAAQVMHQVLSKAV